MTAPNLPRPITVNAQFIGMDEALAAFRVVAAEMFAAGYAEGQRSTLPPVLNVTAASRRFGVSRERIEGWMAGGQLDSKRVGSRLLVPTAQLVALTEGGKPKRVQRTVGRQ